MNRKIMFIKIYNSNFSVIEIQKADKQQLYITQKDKIFVIHSSVDRAFWNESDLSYYWSWDGTYIS